MKIPSVTDAPERGLELRLQRSEQLLSAEPSILTGSRLTPELGEWIEEEWRRRRGRSLDRLHVSLPDEESRKCSDLGHEIRRHFEAKAAGMQLRRRETVVRGMASARIGLLFLVVVLLSAELINVLEGRIPEILSEGLSIFAWVALWRPTEELLYDWYPHAQDLARYQALAALKVELRSVEQNTR